LEITGEYRIKAPRQEVWQALNDPEILRRSIPGCDQLEKTAEQEFVAKVQSKIGPVKAKFNCKVALTNLNAPQSYTLVGEGQGGVAGFAQGSADVSLEEIDATETLLNYSAEFKIGGKLAQVGSRLVAGATRKTADQFFANFADIMNPDATLPSETEQNS
jgi:carbon monoxide dehydrogenase subunit G